MREPDDKRSSQSPLQWFLLHQVGQPAPGVERTLVRSWLSWFVPAWLLLPCIALDKLFQHPGHTPLMWSMKNSEYNLLNVPSQFYLSDFDTLNKILCHRETHVIGFSSIILRLYSFFAIGLLYEESFKAHIAPKNKFPFTHSSDQAVAKKKKTLVLQEPILSGVPSVYVWDTSKLTFLDIQDLWNLLYCNRPSDINKRPHQIKHFDTSAISHSLLKPKALLLCNDIVIRARVTLESGQLAVKLGSLSIIYSIYFNQATF